VNKNEETMSNLRIKVVVSAAAILLGGAGLGVITAAPASAAPTCTATFNDEDDNGRWAWVPAGGGNWDCQMRSGDSGEAVKALQNTLKRCYGHNLSVDGQFGPRTKSALASAQQKAGASADGIYGPQTFNKINWPYMNEANAQITCHRY
jgi:peptidoglycan hydrolase-like protein with peptidoglycan-binding domain